MKLCMSIVAFIFLQHVTKMMLTKLKVKLNMHDTATGTYKRCSPGYSMGRSFCLLISLAVIW